LHWNLVQKWPKKWHVTFESTPIPLCYFVTLSRTPPLLRVSCIIWMAPKWEWVRERERENIRVMGEGEVVWERERGRGRDDRTQKPQFMFAHWAKVLGRMAFSRTFLRNAKKWWKKRVQNQIKDRREKKWEQWREIEKSKQQQQQQQQQLSLSLLFLKILCVDLLKGKGKQIN